MRTIPRQAIVDTVASMCMAAGRYLPGDVLEALTKAEKNESLASARGILTQLVDNAALSSKTGLPLCQDCGLGVFFVEVGEDVRVEGGTLREAINAGMVQGYLTGVIYTGRDAAHKRLVEALDAGQPLPFDPKGAVIYYVGPSPAIPGYAIGAAGPTTSYRMDSYAPRLMEQGLKGMIGKGMRSAEVKKAMIEHKAVYFGATGGAGALLSVSIKEAKVIAYEDLGPEAIRELVVENFPVIVINDCRGGDQYAIPNLEAALAQA